MSGASALLVAPAVAVGRRYKAARQLARRPAAMVALAVVLGFILVALAAPQLAPFDPTAIDFRAVRKPPSAVHRLGTDEVGRDVLSRLLWGARASLLAGVIPVTIAVALSVPLGLLSGYLGGWLDGLIMRINDAMLSIPFLIVAIALAAFLGPGLGNAMIAIGIAACRPSSGSCAAPCSRSRRRNTWRRRRPWGARGAASRSATSCPTRCRRSSSR